MKKVFYSLFIPALIIASASCCTNVREVEIEIGSAVTTISAYMDDASTKTGYVIDDVNNVARFNWLEGDQIDATVNIGKAFTFLRFKAKSAGTAAEFTQADGEDGITLESLKKIYPTAALADQAFYPSRGDAEAQDNKILVDWDIRPSGQAIVSIPPVISANPGNPLAVVPLLGIRDDEGKYAFKPVTAVLAIPVKNITADMDFISISHEGIALSGSFIADGQVTQEGVLSGAGHSLTLSFSGIEGDATFYFPVPGGEVPAGLNIRCGKSSDSEGQMSLTTKNAVTFKTGKISKCGEITFQVEDQQWAKYADAEFIDDFIWGAHSAYTAGTRVAVTVERSGVHPEKYRINNPYTVANTQFGYTPYTEGVEADDYFVFYIEDGALRYNTFRTGVEDKDSGGKPMMITYSKVWSSSKTGAETKVVSALSDGSPTELQFGAMYSQYVNPASYMYTRDGEGNASTDRIHLYIDQSERWLDVAEGEFIDELIWGNHGWGTTRIPVTLQQKNGDDTKLRIANPYLKMAKEKGFSTYTEGITGTEYIELTPLANNLIKFSTFLTGIEDKPSGGKPMKVWYPTDWGGSYDVSYNKVLSWRSDGLPGEIQLAAMYSDPVTVSHKYTKYNVPTMHLYFPEGAPETWVPVATAQYKDDFIVNNRMGKGTNKFVEATLEQSTSDPARFRIANPYPALCELAGNPANYMYSVETSDYLVMTVNSDDTVSYEEFIPGVGDASKALAICDPAVWNTLAEDSKTTGKSRVTAYKGNGLPMEIKLYAMYHEIGNYKKGGVDGNWFYSRDTEANGDVIVIRLPDLWTSIGTGKFKDKFVWSCAGLSDYAQVEFQQNESSPNSYRIAKPYPGENSGEWFCFDVSNPDKVTSDNYFVDVEVTASGKATFKPWVRNGVDYGYNFSSVFKTQDNGKPAIVQIGPCYRGDAFDGTVEGYIYEIGKDHEQLAIEIVFPGCLPYDAEHPDAKVNEYSYPMVANFHNPISGLVLPNGTLQKLVVKISGVNPSAITGLRLYQNGWMDSDYVAPDSDGVVTMTSFTNATVSGTIDLNMRYTGNIMGSAVQFEVLEAVVDGLSCTLYQDVSNHFPGVRLNNGGDAVSVRGASETVASFRIPALVTSNDGTLIAAYDVRYDSSADLQADIDVGVKRSTDGGKTWSALNLAMDMGAYGYEGQIAAGTMTRKQAEQQNGIGDPCLLVDENTGDIFCFAVWTHGHAGQRSLSYAGTGYDIDVTPQYMMVFSKDDGKTWSAPVNITRQVKKYDWRMTFQGPGRGITMKDGTLVVPMQHQENGVLNSGVMYSTDHGLSWHAYDGFARHTTSECAVAEIAPGTLMLTMRDETNAHYRAVYTTTDLGRTWTPHASDGKVIEPTCEASLLHVDAEKNSLGKDLLLFSNPNSQSGRNHIAIQASFDQGVTWSHKLVVDQGGGNGYSCLTMVDSGTVGIVYESSKGDIVFQAVPLADIVK